MEPRPFLSSNKDTLPQESIGNWADLPQRQEGRKELRHQTPGLPSPRRHGPQTTPGLSFFFSKIGRIMLIPTFQGCCRIQWGSTYKEVDNTWNTVGAQ